MQQQKQTEFAKQQVTPDGYFEKNLIDADAEIFDAISSEWKRQKEEIELIASENIVSKAVLQAQGCLFTNKYAEGYPDKRYYCGCENFDKVEIIAIERAKKLFQCNFANVQPNSGSQANQAVMLAFAKPGDTILAMALDAGGHLTHGAKVNLSGKWFNSVTYGVRKDSLLIDYQQVREKALESKPKIIIAGASAYPRIIDFEKFRQIADEVGALLLVDMAHIAGLVAAGVHPNPIEHAHVVTTTTHKTLRGARGGLILTNHEDVAKKINSAVFPGLQGGPLAHIVAAKAVCFGEALHQSFRKYGEQIIDNAHSIAQTLQKHHIDVLTGGTENHLVLVDLRSVGLTGSMVADALSEVNITCNKNAVPYDTQPPTITSGVRFGTAAITTRGFEKQQSAQTAELIAETIENLKTNNGEMQKEVKKEIKNKVLQLCQKFPIYSNISNV